MKKIIYLLSLIQFSSFSNEIKLTIFQDYTIRQKATKALIKVEKEKEVDLSKLEEELKNYSANLKFLNFSNKYEENIEGYKISLTLNNGYNMLFEVKAKSKEEAKEKLIKEVENLKDTKLVKYNIEKIYSNKAKVFKEYLIEVKNLTKINEVIDLCKKYKLEIQTPKYISANAKFSYEDILTKSEQKAKDIANKLKYKLNNKRYVLTELKNNEIEYNMPIYFAKSESNILVPDKNSKINTKVEYILNNKNNKKLEGKIKIYGEASEYVKPSKANITIEVNSDDLVEKLKPYGFKTESYEYYKTYSDEVEEKILLELKPVKINNVAYLLKNIEQLKIEDNTRENVLKKAQDIKKQFKAKGVELEIDNQSIKKQRKNNEKMYLSHILTAEISDMEKLNELFINLAKLNLRNIRVSYEVDDKKIYIKALDNALEKLKSFKAYEITSIRETQNSRNEFNSLPIKLTKTLEIEANVER